MRLVASFRPHPVRLPLCARSTLKCLYSPPKIQEIFWKRVTKRYEQIHPLLDIGFDSFTVQILSCEDKNDAMIVDIDNLNEWAGFGGIANERMQMVIDSVTNANETASQPVATGDTSDLGSPLSSSDGLGGPVNLIPFRYAISYFDGHEYLTMPKNKVQRKDIRLWIKAGVFGVIFGVCSVRGFDTGRCASGMVAYLSQRNLLDYGQICMC